MISAKRLPFITLSSLLTLATSSFAQTSIEDTNVADSASSAITVSETAIATSTETTSIAEDATNGSGAAAPTFDDYQAKNFLTDYSRIGPSKTTPGAFGYIDPDADFGKYNKLLVDRIRVWYKQDSDYQGIDPEELKEITDYFYEAIEREVGSAYPMVAEAGPDVLRLRIAITDLVPNKPEASVTSLVVPFMWVGEAGAGAAQQGEIGSTPFTGEATLEFEALDSDSSRQLAAFIETKTGKKYNWTEGVSEGVDSYLKAYSTWAYTKQAIDDWAKRLRLRLDEAHGKKTAN